MSSVVTPTACAVYLTALASITPFLVGIVLCAMFLTSGRSYSQKPLSPHPPPSVQWGLTLASVCIMWGFTLLACAAIFGACTCRQFPSHERFTKALCLTAVAAASLSVSFPLLLLTLAWVLFPRRWGVVAGSSPGAVFVCKNLMLALGVVVLLITFLWMVGFYI